MKLTVESLKTKDHEMGVGNNSASVENTSAASTNQSTADGNQLNKMPAVEIASTSKEEVVMKQEDSELLTPDVLNSDSTSEDSMVTSTSESSSSESQEFEITSEENVLGLKVGDSVEIGESDVFMNVLSYVQDTVNAAALTSQQTKMPSEENKDPSNINIKDSKIHREKDHYSSDSSDYETEESPDSSDYEDFLDNLRKSVPLPKLPVMKTKGELLIEDLPPVEDLHITVKEAELVQIGYFSHSIINEERKEFLVIVESDGISKPLLDDSVLFLSSDNPLGKIHDVFGNVNKPNYAVRFNNAEDINNKGLTKRQVVYYSPENDTLTHYVLVDALRKQKGSDASWKDNNEPPDDQIDYSDDEQEKVAKQKRRAKNRHKEPNWDDDVVDVTPIKMNMNVYNKRRDFSYRPSRNGFQSPTPGPSRSSPHSCSPRTFHQTPPPSHHFGSSGLPTNFISPLPFGHTSSNSASFQPSPQRSVASPHFFGPVPHSNVPSPHPLGMPPQSNGPFQPFVPPPHSNVPSPQAFGLPLLSNGQSQVFGLPPHSNVPSPQHFGLPLLGNGQSQVFGPPPHSNVPSPQAFGLPLLSNGQSQVFGQLQPNNGPSPQPFGTFPQSSASSYQPVTAPQASGVLTSPNLPSSHATHATSFFNPSLLMPAPQSNVPLQQQFQLQSQQPNSTFVSRPPPNYNSHQNPGTFLYQHQSFTPPTFGALPAARPAMQNTSNQSSVNQVAFSLGGNAPVIGLSGNLNVSQPTNIAPMNSNGHQGPSFSMVQSNAANPFTLPQFHNRIHPPVTQVVFAAHPLTERDQQGSPILPRPNRPILSIQTPPPLPNQQNGTVFSSVHPPNLPIQNQPPISHSFSSPYAGNSVSPQNHRPPY